MDERAEAIEELYRRRYGAFRNTLATITGSYETARDSVQEAFARALAQRRSFRGEGSLEAWVWKIAFRAALEQRPDSGLVQTNGFPEPALPEPELDPELAEAVKKLPPRRRLIVFLRYFADLSYDEIADICGISEGTVGAALAHARSALAEQLATERGET